MRTSASLVFVLFSLVALAPRANAQTSHAAPPSAIDAALQEKVSGTSADREVVLRLLDRSEVKELAGDVGLDLRRAHDAIATLDGQELTELAAQARQVDESLAGGQSRITISTTLLIIALLVLILLIVALK
jgi:hypothetical protein